MRAPVDEVCPSAYTSKRTSPRVAAHPLEPGWLIGLLPLRRNSSAAIAAACSRNGIDWSAPRPLLSCSAHYNRAHGAWRGSALPVHGGVQLLGGELYLWVQARGRTAKYMCYGTARAMPRDDGVRPSQ